MFEMIQVNVSFFDLLNPKIDRGTVKKQSFLGRYIFYLDFRKTFSEISSLTLFVVPNIVHDIDPRPKFSEQKISTMIKTV